MKNLLLLISISFLLIFSGCAVSENFGADAEENKRQSITVEESFENAFRTSIQVASNQKWSIENSDSSAGFFRATTPSGMSAWEDEVSVTFSENEDDTTTITTDSSLGQEPNRKIIKEFLDEVVNRLE